MKLSGGVDRADTESIPVEGVRQPSSDRPPAMAAALDLAERTEVDSPLVSVILPTRNRREFLAEAVESVLRQKYTNFELIVIDGGSSDGTRSLLESMQDDRLRVIRRERAHGLSNARNVALEAAKGRYLVFLDDDDQLFEDAIGRLVETIQDRPSECGGVYTGRVHRNKTGKTTESRVDRGPVECFTDLSVGGPSCTLVRRDVIDEIGEFDESMPSREDADFWFRLLSEYRLFALDEVLYERRLHEGQMIEDPELMLRGQKRFVAKHGDDLPDETLVSRVSWMAATYAELDDDTNARSTIQRTEQLVTKREDSISAVTVIRAYCRLADAYELLGESAQARSSLQRAEDVLESAEASLSKSDLASACNRLAHCCARLGMFSAARATLRRTLRRTPSMKGHWFYYFWFHFGGPGYRIGSVIENRVRQFW